VKKLVFGIAVNLPNMSNPVYIVNHRY